MKLEYKTVWISDTHLGSKGARAKDLSRFLKQVRCEKLYLVGDIIDCWRLKSRWYWPDAHNDVIRRILKHASRGTEVVYIPGNHDDAARQFVNMAFGGVDIKPHTQHTTANGKQLFITHGDQYDLIIQHSKWLSVLGSVAYESLLRLNRHYNTVRRWFGLPYASLSQAIKLKVKRACTFISKFEEILASEAKKRGMDGVVCGHIHKAEQRTMDNGIQYLNCGDWVESCSALVEHADGSLEIIDGIKVVEQLKAARLAERNEQDSDPNDDDDLIEEGEEDAVEWVAADRALFGAFRPIMPEPSNSNGGHDLKTIRGTSIPGCQSAQPNPYSHQALSLPTAKNACPPDEKSGGRGGACDPPEHALLNASIRTRSDNSGGSPSLDPGHTQIKD